MGIPGLCSRWWELWLLVDRRGTESAQYSGRQKDCSDGEEETESGARRTGGTN